MGTATTVLSYFDSTTLLIFCLTLAALYLWRKKKHRNLPPGPKPLFFYGSTLFNDPAKFTGRLVEYEKIHGPVVTIYLGRRPTILINSFDAVHEAFIKNADKLSSRPNDLFTVSQGGIGIIFKNGEDWKKSRRFTLHTFRDMGVGKNTLQERIHEETLELFKLFPSSGSEPFSPRECLQMAVSNIISSVVFGSRFQYDDEDFVNLLKLMDILFTDVENSVGPFNLVNFIPLLRAKFILMNILKPNHGLAESLKLFAKFDNFVAKVTKQHRDTFAKNNIRDFIDVYLEIIETTKDRPFTEGEMPRLLFDLFAAGTDTTSTTLNWALLFMIAHPEIQQRCFEEIEREVGTSRMVTMADKTRLPYLVATMWEIQRVAGIARISLPHRADCDMQFRGYDIPEGTIVIANIYSCLNDEMYWDEPAEFRPDRFIGEDGKLKSNEAFIPFSLGPRVCLGESMARMELFLFFANLIQRYHFRKANSDPLNMESVAGITHSPVPYKLLCSLRHAG